MNPEPIGCFRVTTPVLVVIDPGYRDRGNGLAFNNARRGMWRCSVNRRHRRITRLTATHEDAPRRLRWKSVGLLPVDSGQMAIFGPECQDDDFDLFYQSLCQLSASEATAGIFDEGCVSSSGPGNGHYPVDLALDQSGHLAGVRVRFLE